MQSIEARTELRLLMNYESKIITPQKNNPIMGLTQDSLIAFYLLSYDEIDTFMFYDCIMSATDFVKVEERSLDINQARKFCHRFIKEEDREHFFENFVKAQYPLQRMIAERYEQIGSTEQQSIDFEEFMENTRERKKTIQKKDEESEKSEKKSCKFKPIFSEDILFPRGQKYEFGDAFSRSQNLLSRAIEFYPEYITKIVTKGKPILYKFSKDKIPGKLLISFIFPENLCYVKKTDGKDLW